MDEQNQPERKARITLGAVVVENRDISLGQCRLSYLMGAGGLDLTELLRYYVYHNFLILGKVDEMTGRTLHVEDGVDQRRARGREYLNLCRDYAHHVAEEMKKWGVHAYEMETIGPQTNNDGTHSYRTLGTFTSGDEIPREAWGKVIEDLPDEGIAIFTKTLDEKLNNVETNTLAV